MEGVCEAKIGPMPERTKRLRDRMRWYKPELCSERARLATEAYKETEGEPIVIRRAKVLDRVLRGMSIYINEDELIVGNQACKPRAAPVFFPEDAVGWIERDVDSGWIETRPQDPFIVPEKVKQELRQVFPYWRDRALRDKFHKRLPENAALAYEAGAIQFRTEGGLGHHVLDFPKVLQQGFEGIKQEVLRRLEQVDLAEPGAHKKWEFWRALCIACDAVMAYARRYAEEARALAAAESNAQRKGELERIAEVCARVPSKPARTFHEALQAVWFVMVIAHLSENNAGVTTARFDQYMYPYYKRDIEEGRITQEEAQELLECFWVKYEEINKLRSMSKAQGIAYQTGYVTSIAIGTGGQKRLGEDATTELTYMCLDAQAHVHLKAPQYALRVHRGTPQDLLVKAAEVIKLGGGPSLLSDNIYVPSLLELGVPLEDALGYVNSGCSEPNVLGAWGYGRTAHLNPLKVLELVLNDGVDPSTGKQVGLPTGDPLTFACFDDLMRAFREQLAYMVSLGVQVVNSVSDPIVVEELPHVFFSLLTPDCIDKGLDVTVGGARYNWTAFCCGGGLATTANSLAAMKKLVFEEKKISMSELKQALADNFEGKESIRQMLLRAPKYGNDDDYVDAIARAVYNAVCDEVGKYRDSRGGKFALGLYTEPHLGVFVGASANGRKAREFVSDGVSPDRGTDTNGPTACMKSVGKLGLIRAADGAILNISFSPSIMQQAKDVGKFVELNRTFLCDLGGMLVQHNVFSAETLRDAQKHPEKYRDLVVRVVGYSAFFVELGKERQDELIARTEHSAF